VREWFSSRLGNTTPTVRAANAVLRGPGHERRGRVISLSRLRDSPPIASVGDAALIGHASDWLLRLALVDEPPPEQSAAALGACRISAMTSTAGALVVFEQVVERCLELAPARGSLNELDWLALCRCCLLLGWLERAYRAPFGAETIIDRVEDAADADGWAEVLVKDLDLEDLSQLGCAAVADHSDLRDGRRLVANPTFALSAGLGGADADLIAGATLLDLKSTATTRPLTRSDLWQLVGYALADTDDTFELTDVGISALRWRTRVTWSIHDLLSQLAGEPLPLARARDEFAAIVGQLRGG